MEANEESLKMRSELKENEKKIRRERKELKDNIIIKGMSRRKRKIGREREREKT